jgi:hypothetical protein
MLDHEYRLLLERLVERRGSDTCFFAFADTVATRGPGRDAGDGWMGVRFQHAPTSEPSEILVHVGMRDRARVHEQEALGILGVNLIYAAFQWYGIFPIVTTAIGLYLLRDTVVNRFPPGFFESGAAESLGL